MVNFRNTWEHLSNKCNICDKCNIGLKKGENICFEKDYIAEDFNSFFYNIATKLVVDLPLATDIHIPETLFDYFKSKGVYDNSFEFTDVNPDEVKKLLMCMNVFKAKGCNNIPPRFLHDGAEILCIPLSHIINISVRQGIFPDDLKTAKSHSPV